MASDPTKDKVQHAVKGVDPYATNAHHKAPHGLVPNEQDKEYPFLSRLVEDGIYHATNTPNGCAYGDTSGKDRSPGFGIQGPQMNGFRLTFGGDDADGLNDGNRSGE